jgi:hypothetical protein
VALPARRRFRLLVVLMEAKKRVAARWGRPIGDFGCPGRLSVTEAKAADNRAYNSESREKSVWRPLSGLSQRF